MVGATRIAAVLKMKGLSSPYEKTYKGAANKQHILLLGDSNPEAIQRFFSEYFHGDHGQNEQEVVLCQDRDPSPEITAILKNSEFNSKIQYIKGDPL